jgi:hypothetical protein
MQQVIHFPKAEVNLTNALSLAQFESSQQPRSQTLAGVPLQQSDGIVGRGMRGSFCASRAGLTGGSRLSKRQLTENLTAVSLRL